MPPLQGEVSLTTLYVPPFNSYILADLDSFADVHYYFSPPSTKPQHHRFDKSSYVYLYHNPIQQRGRIEVANHAGTPEQDAFNGYLDSVRIEQSYKQPCLFTITVDAFRNQGGSATSSPQQDMSEWHLPALDPRNDSKYMYRLHTVDIYFWTADDATMFLDSLKRVTQPHQLQIITNPMQAPNEHKTDMLSPVIQKLEQAAISKPYQGRSPSVSTTQSFPGPPTAPAPTVGSPEPTGYAPLAYNPAAPAAPEPVAHREKTPPPPDAADGTGLATAAMNDHHAVQYGNPLQSSFAPQPTAGQPYMPGPPSRTNTQTFSGSPTPGIQRTSTTGSLSLPPPPPSTSVSPPHGQPYGQSFAPPPSAPHMGQYDATPQPGLQRHSTMPMQYANYPGSPGHPPVQSPGLPSPGYPPQYQSVHSPGLPPSGGYAQYQYNANQGQPSAENSYGLHQQLYRPTEQEATIRHNEPPPAPKEKHGNLEKRAEKIEKGVGRFLKRLDKKL
ncbi:hypothetical protein GQ43DRAFT_282542 [Delitschia confertaspora ATCC 74209]|uniref:RNA recognition motif-containing protein n=1 Tax=Delitschia confertaspora ATCC 74209 TaxID=1513339 RepID=A0A9P4JV83_9PLEO|nr:hypothetical protein GQ43DRAFT_282542 [Delitschia confertaspora ATCC 74209]